MAPSPAGPPTVMAVSHGERSGLLRPLRPVAVMTGCQERVDGRLCKRRAKYRVQTAGGTWLLCNQHTVMVQSWTTEASKVYVHELAEHYFRSSEPVVAGSPAEEGAE